mgnify:CR=1 FL=1
MIRDVLFVSNGFGEDTIAASIVEEIQRVDGAPRVLAMPLVGEGLAYQRLGVEIVGPRRSMPSGGLIMAGWSHLLKDLRAGFWGMTIDQIRTLRHLRGRLGALVAVGDTIPALMGGLFGGGRVTMVGTAKSNYFYAYSWYERVVFRRFCDVVFTRDEATAVTLRAQGVTARWVGNAMMDSLGETPLALPVPPDVPCIALLPGSRKLAFHDLPVILEAARQVGQRRPTFYVMALADSIALPELVRAAETCGWTHVDDPAFHGPASQGCEGLLVGHGQRVLLVRGRFGDVIVPSRIVIGQAGTGNEQAVGMGRPVVSFDSEGRKVPGWYRARQKGLLGDSVAVVDRSAEAVAREVETILDDDRRYAAMAETGFARMGPPGASARMAAHIVEQARRRP